MDALGWEKLLTLPAALIVLVVILYFAYRIFQSVLPHWKETRMAEIKVREVEANSRMDEASIFGKLSESLNTMTDVMKQITIEQRRDTDKMHILQRVNTDTNSKILNKLDMFDELVESHDAICGRLSVVEYQIEQNGKPETETPETN